MTEKDLRRETMLIEIIWERDQTILNLLEEIQILKNKLNELLQKDKNDE